MPEAHFTIFDKYRLDCHDSLTEKGRRRFGRPFVSDRHNRFCGTPAENLKFAQFLRIAARRQKNDLPLRKKTVFLDNLSHEFVAAREILRDSGGVITMRRLNRREYENTIFDLLGVSVDAKNLPGDENLNNYYTTGAPLFFSSD